MADTHVGDLCSVTSPIMTRSPFLLLALALLPATKTFSQGCSDAGVCTAGPIGELELLGDSLQPPPKPGHMARLTFSYAVGERNTTITQGVLELGFGLTDRWGVQVKLPYQHASGNLGTHSGLGDPVITASYQIKNEAGRRLTGLVGMKLPANDARAAVDGLDLPMPYQTSLGTTDLLLGLNYRHQRWNAALAYQHVLSHGNANAFTHSLWMDDMNARGYFESWKLERANDAVGRIQYALPIGDLAIQPGLLAIYHLGEDTRLESPDDATGSNLRLPERVAVEGSEGLTLNVTLDARYRFNDHWALELSYGSPLVVREERPDGLTRTMVLNLGVAHTLGR